MNITNIQPPMIRRSISIICPLILVEHIPDGVAMRPRPKLLAIDVREKDLHTNIGHALCRHGARYNFIMPNGANKMIDF